MSVSSPLEGFPRPNVAVDLAILTVRPTSHPAVGDQLCVLVQERRRSPHGRVLPGRFMRERHTIEQTVQEVLEIKVRMATGRVAPTLLRTFSEPARDERAWTISIAHAVALSIGRLTGVSGTLVPVGGSGELQLDQPLLFDHDLIVHEAVHRMRERYETQPDPDGLIAQPFTLAELRHLHEAVLGERVRKDSFNRRMRPSLRGLETSDGTDLTRTAIGRPAQLFRKSEATSLTSFERWRLPRG